MLFLTAPDTNGDRAAVFRARAGDYATKPFSLEEVALRPGAILRGSGMLEAEEPEPLRYADLELNEDFHEARRAGTPIRLSPAESTLLHY